MSEEVIKPVTWREAEAFISRRVDRRRSYAIGPTLDPNKSVTVLLETVSWTGSCSGCCEGGEYGGLLHLYSYDEKAQCHVGAGCSECGHTGKRRNSMWMDYSAARGRE